MSRPRTPSRSTPSAAPEHPMSEDMIAAVAGRFRALGEPIRLRLLEILCQGARSVTDLASEAGTSQANTSKHLAVLAAAGFVARRREGNRVLYAPTDATPQQLCGVICQHVVRGAEDELKRFRGSTRAGGG